MLAVLAGVVRRQGEGVRDPAVGVDHLWARDGVIGQAVDGIADQVEGRDQDARGEEEGAGETVVQPEHGVVRYGLVRQETYLQSNTIQLPELDGLV